MVCLVCMMLKFGKDGRWYVPNRNLGGRRGVWGKFFLPSNYVQYKWNTARAFSCEIFAKEGWKDEVWFNLILVLRWNKALVYELRLPILNFNLRDQAFSLLTYEVRHFYQRHFAVTSSAIVSTDRNTRRFWRSSNGVEKSWNGAMRDWKFLNLKQR